MSYEVECTCTYVVARGRGVCLGATNAQNVAIVRAPIHADANICAAAADISRRDSTLYSHYICIHIHLRLRGPISTVLGKYTELRRPGLLECEGRGRERLSAGCALSTRVKHNTQRSAVTDGERLGSSGITESIIDMWKGVRLTQYLCLGYW